MLWRGGSLARKTTLNYVKPCQTTFRDSLFWKLAHWWVKLRDLVGVYHGWRILSRNFRSSQEVPWNFFGRNTAWWWEPGFWHRSMGASKDFIHWRVRFQWQGWAAEESINIGLIWSKDGSKNKDIERLNQSRICAIHQLLASPTGQSDSLPYFAKIIGKIGLNPSIHKSLVLISARTMTKLSNFHIHLWL